MKLPVIFSLLVLSLTSCSDSGRSNIGSAENSLSAVNVKGVVCAPAGTIAVRDNGDRIIYRGPSLGGVGACSIGTSAQRSDLIGNIVLVNPLNVVQRGAALSNIFPLRVGNTSVAYFSNGNTGGTSIPNFEEVWTVKGEGSFDVGNEKRDCWILERREKPRTSSYYTFTYTYLIDKELGIPLSYRGVSGSSAAPRSTGWQVVEIRAPQTRPPRNS